VKCDDPIGKLCQHTSEEKWRTRSFPEWRGFARINSSGSKFWLIEVSSVDEETRWCETDSKDFLQNETLGRCHKPFLVPIKGAFTLANFTRNFALSLHILLNKNYLFSLLNLQASAKSCTKSRQCKRTLIWIFPLVSCIAFKDRIYKGYMHSQVLILLVYAWLTRSNKVIKLKVAQNTSLR